MSLEKGYEFILINDSAKGSKLFERLDRRFVPEGVSHVHVNLKDSVDEWEMFGAKVGVHYSAGEDPRAIAVFIRGLNPNRDAARDYLAEMAGGALN